MQQTGTLCSMGLRPKTTLGVMKIPALRIEINGKQVAVAGAEGLSLLSGQVGLGAGSKGNIDLESIVFSVMGLDVAGTPPRQLTWVDGIQLKPGDRVTFEVVETESPTPPSNVRRTPSAEQLAAAALADKPVAKKSRR
jgi:hypothetical protein